MKLYKIIATMLCSILFLSACSTLTKEEYIDAVAKEENEAVASISKAEDMSLTLDERKTYIDKTIKAMQNAKKISPPDEFTSAHEEYKKYAELLTKEFEKVKEKLNDKSLYESLDKKTFDKMTEHEQNFRNALGSEWKEKYSNKLDKLD
ncbi:MULTISPECIES: hypothetical protein [Bacillus]|uniref:hypothetical protein n=1 Tax=Bacillus TaxID=1386 RepID=UPI000B5DA70F|nr:MULTISPECIES: hypothetical protein [Bacillus]OXB95177.1 hypothetical protein CGQ22_30900 [Bacillus sp. M13(2017)]QCY65055.1 hypothetical protein FHE73_30845 [Bacillus thuringiensis]QCY65068.1 hypothetical protein FHE73_30930 [Bacillus thuringiensis]